MSDDLYFALIALLIGCIVAWVTWKFPEPGAEKKEDRGFEVMPPKESD